MTVRWEGGREKKDGAEQTSRRYLCLEYVPVIMLVFCHNMSFTRCLLAVIAWMSIKTCTRCPGPRMIYIEPPKAYCIAGSSFSSIYKL